MHEHTKRGSGQYKRVVCTQCMDPFIVEEHAPLLAEEALCPSCGDDMGRLPAQEARLYFAAS